MSGALDLTLLSESRLNTGSWYPNASSTGLLAEPVTSKISVSFHTGSWTGLGNTWGSQSLTGTLNGLTGSVAGGHWWGISYSWGTFSPPSESYDRFHVIDEEHPYVNQSIGPGFWDPFPESEIAPEVALPPRDLTRYKKAYSHQRTQPVRIRLVRK